LLSCEGDGSEATLLGSSANDNARDREAFVKTLRGLGLGVVIETIIDMVMLVALLVAATIRVPSGLARILIVAAVGLLMIAWFLARWRRFRRLRRERDANGGQDEPGA
jgi:hypothetical protein